MNNVKLKVCLSFENNKIIYEVYQYFDKDKSIYLKTFLDEKIAEKYAENNLLKYERLHKIEKMKYDKL